jgi:hypothetical protein
MRDKSLQLTFAPKSICFGCGPANKEGLRINSFVDGDSHLRAWVVELEGSRTLVEGELSSGDNVCATCRGSFVEVKKGHPAYFRW